MCVLMSRRRDGKALERFLQDYFDGNLKRYLKSEPIPENNDGPVKVMLLNRKGENSLSYHLRKDGVISFPLTSYSTARCRFWWLRTLMQL